MQIFKYPNQTKKAVVLRYTGSDNHEVQDLANQLMDIIKQQQEEAFSDESDDELVQKYMISAQQTPTDFVYKHYLEVPLASKFQENIKKLVQAAAANDRNSILDLCRTLAEQVSIQAKELPTQGIPSDIYKTCVVDGLQPLMKDIVNHVKEILVAHAKDEKVLETVQSLFPLADRAKDLDDTILAAIERVRNPPAEPIPAAKPTTPREVSIVSPRDAKSPREMARTPRADDTIQQSAPSFEGAIRVTAWKESEGESASEKPVFSPKAIEWEKFLLSQDFTPVLRDFCLKIQQDQLKEATELVKSLAKEIYTMVDDVRLLFENEELASQLKGLDDLPTDLKDLMADFVGFFKEYSWKKDELSLRQLMDSVSSLGTVYSEANTLLGSIKKLQSPLHHLKEKEALPPSPVVEAFFKHTPDNNDNNKAEVEQTIWLKCMLNQDSRMVKVSKMIKLQQLKKLIRERFGEASLLQEDGSNYHFTYKDSSSDIIDLKSDDDVEFAFDDFLTSKANKLEVSIVMKELSIPVPSIIIDDVGTLFGGLQRSRSQSVREKAIEESQKIQEAGVLGVPVTARGRTGSIIIEGGAASLLSQIIQQQPQSNNQQKISEAREKLMNEIRGGMNLKKTHKQIRQPVRKHEGLSAVLANALESRRKNIKEAEEAAEDDDLSWL